MAQQIPNKCPKSTQRHTHSIITQSLYIYILQENVCNIYVAYKYIYSIFILNSSTSSNVGLESAPMPSGRGPGFGEPSLVTKPRHHRVKSSGNMRLDQHMGVSKNRGGSPKSSILTGFSITKPSMMGYQYFWKHPIYC